MAEAASTSDGRQMTIKNDVPVSVYPQSACYDSVSEVQATRKAATSTKQGRVYENIDLVQAPTHARLVHLNSKDRCIRDRVLMKCAYLQGTLSHTQQENDMDILDTTKEERSKRHIESKTDTAFITKKLSLNKESSTRCFIKEPSVMDSLANENNITLKEFQKSEVKAAKSDPKLAESKGKNTCNRSVKEVVKLKTHKERCELGIQMHLRKKDSASRSIDDESTFHSAKLLAKSTASQTEETKASVAKINFGNESTDKQAKNECLVSSSAKLSANVIVKAIGSIKNTPVGDRFMSSRDLVGQIGFPNQMRDELELMSSEHKTFSEHQGRKVCSSTERSLTKKEKAPTKQVSIQERRRKLENELVRFKHHHSASGRKVKIGKSVLPVKLDEKFNTEREEAPRNVATTRELSYIVQNRLLQPMKLPDTVSRATKDSVEERSINDHSTSSKKIWKSQRRKVESVQGKMCNRSVKEMVYLRQSSNVNCSEAEVKLHSGDKSGSMNTTKKDKKYELERPVNKKQLPKGMKGISRGKKVEAVIPEASCSMITDKTPPLKYKNDERDPNLALTLDCESVATVSCKHKPQILSLIQQLSRLMPEQNTSAIEDPKSAIKKVATRRWNKVTMQQSPFKFQATDTLEQDLEKPKWNQKANCKHGTSQISKDKSENHAQVTTCEDQNLNEESEPELPARSYLEDIDFVTNEFDMILRSNPELPARTYLKDTDFASKEFDLLPERKPTHQYKQQQKSSTCSSSASEASHALSQLSTNPCDHSQPLASSQNSSPEGEYTNQPLLKVPHDSTFYRENSSEDQYQPLMARDPPHRYELVAVKSQKILKEDQSIDEASANGEATELNDSPYQPLLCFASHECPEKDYCMPFTKPILSAENKDHANLLLISGKSQRSLQFPPTCTSSESHEKVQPKNLEAARMYRNLPGRTVHKIQVTTAMTCGQKQFKYHHKSTFGHPAFQPH